ncbi:MAG: acyl dehydratase [Porticoccus sp.]|jgi:acyl dehydratase
MAEQISGKSEWIEISQEQINQFADVTGDHQCIHVSPERAAKTKFGGPVAHGFLSLSLIPHLIMEALVDQIGRSTVLNYGVNRLRFIVPIRPRNSIRLHWNVVCTEQKKNGLLLTIDVVIEIKGEEKPALTAEWLVYIID